MFVNQIYACMSPPLHLLGPEVGRGVNVERLVPDDPGSDAQAQEGKKDELGSGHITAVAAASPSTQSLHTPTLTHALTP